jgi:hypothetical protein
MRFLLRIVVGLGLVLAVAMIVVIGVGAGWFGSHEAPGVIRQSSVSKPVLDARLASQRAAASERGVDAASPKQILFGDLHVHTTFSADAFLMSLPLASGTGAHPPADACDFARYCSALDFWSINDHAEAISPRHWQETIDTIRACNALSGDPSNPDVVSFLGWEWSQIDFRPETHYGHKNVVLKGLDDDSIPARPIGAASPFQERLRVGRGVLTALALVNGQRGRDYARYVGDLQAMERCPEGVAVRDLPPDCAELVRDPETLFAKLREWDVPAMVIPHGTTWGIYTPPGARWDKQLSGHDPTLQTLVEVYSGHGNTEEYRPWRAALSEPDGTWSCPPPSPGHLPSCWQAGELVRQRCLADGEDDLECEGRAGEARQNHVAAGIAGWRTVPGREAEEWLASGQCLDCFLPAFNYRPANSVQYMLALGEFSDPSQPKRFRVGMIGSSDNHTARPGTGYKEFARGRMTEAPGRREGVESPSAFIAAPRPAASRSEPLDTMTTDLIGLQLFENERATAYFNTGGLVAVHADGRSRDAIWDALGRREVYATSGPRILLWFDLLMDDGESLPMGSVVDSSVTPRFRVRAVGSFEQKPGCPDHSVRGLGPERVARLCLDECHHPSDVRRIVTRIEVVRIRPQTSPDEAIHDLIDDPWRVFPCAPDPGGCSVEFEDAEFTGSARDAVYYVRAIEAPSLAIHADAMNCRYDAAGECVAVDLCNLNTPAEDDCLGETEERAWSSPLFVDFADGDVG